MNATIQCLPLPDIDNGNIQYAPDNTSNYDLGTVATYSCNNGFVLDFSTPGSAETRECVNNVNDFEAGLGEFGFTAPSCNRKYVCSPLTWYSMLVCMYMYY